MKNVFISYSHKDEEYKNQLIAHLSGLVRNKIIHLWDDRQIKIGDSWDATIKNKLEESDVAIFLISSDFLSSSYINEVEIKKTLERHSKGEILLIPVFLRPCDFESSEFSSLQGVPRDARFVVEFPNIDSAFLSIVKELKSLINNFEPVAKVTAIPQKETSNNLLSTNNQWDNCDSPPDIFKWVGRKKELEIINNDLFKVLFITGLGGQGKSSLAAAYILNKNMSHSWIQWDWRDFKEEGHRLKSKLIEIICRFSRDYDDVDFNDIPFPNLYDIFFQAIHGKKIIFVFDNIDAYIDYEKFIPEHDFRIFIEYILQKNHECRFIFTCRPFIKQADVGFFQIELKGFPYEESVELLEQYNISIRNTEKDKLYQELHNLTQGHPLWLNLLAAQATRGIDKLEEFISNITKGVNRGDLTETSIVSERILGELWKSLNNKQKILLRCLSELIKSEEKDEIAKIIAGELNYNQFTRALNNLKLLNLVVTKTKPGREEEIELHPLVKNFLKYILPLNEQSKYISIIIDYYDKVTYILKKRLSGNETLQFYEKWTNKVELAINKRDYRKALVTLEEISVPIQTAGFIEEFFRVTKLTYDSIDFNKAIENEYPNFISTLSSIVTIASELGNFNYAEQTIKRYADIVKNIKEKDRKESKAYEILEEIKKLFHLEATYKKKKLIPNEIVKRRKEDVPLIKEKIKKLVFDSNPLKGSALEGAINYTKECWDDLFTFVNNGYVEISNNIAEQAVKPFVIQRKVFQTSGSYAGARYTTKLFSIVQTCKINNINVERYFDYVLKNINNEQIENLLPYSSKIKNKIG